MLFVEILRSFIVGDVILEIYRLLLWLLVIDVVLDIESFLLCAIIDEILQVYGLLLGIILDVILQIYGLLFCILIIADLFFFFDRRHGGLTK